MWEALCKMLRDPSQVLSAIQSIADDGSAEARELADEIKSLERASSDTDEQADRLLDLYLSGGIAKEKYEAKAATLGERSLHLRSRAEDLAGRRDAALKRVLPVDDVKALCAKYAAGLDGMPFAYRRTLLLTFVTAVTATRTGVKPPVLLVPVVCRCRCWPPTRASAGAGLLRRP